MNKNKKGLLVIFSGPSGSGKGTIMKSLLAGRDDTVLSVSMTTRAPRPGEIDGYHYHFVTHEEFQKTIEEDGFLEYAEYNGNFYGTPEAPIRRLLNEGKNVMLEIEVQGAEKVMDHRSDVVSIFITIPSFEELERRLRGRGDTSEDQIGMRLERAVWEMDQRSWYDHVVVNDQADACANQILEIIANAADEE